MSHLRVLTIGLAILGPSNALSPAVRAAEPFDVIVAKTDAPLLMPWKTIRPDPEYHGQWLVAGDLDGDGQAEIVTARHADQRVMTVLALKLDGSVLWHWGQAGTGKQGLYSDVPVAIYDLDGDGRQEVWLSPAGALLVLDGRTGKERRRLPLPDGLAVADCITFADLRGLGRARDILIKDRYERMWACTDDWKPLWTWQPKKYKTCHHPTPVDINGDGRDEVMAGYSLLNAQGKELWTMAVDGVNLGRGHLDCCRIMTIGNTPEQCRLLVTCCGANCIAMLDGNGKTLWAVTGRHFESIDVGRMRDDLPGRQILVDIAHEPYGKTDAWLLDEQGKRLGVFHCDETRHHRILDWNGDGLNEIMIGNTLRLFNGKGECLLRFGPAGAFGGETVESERLDHGPFVMIGDLDGDERPEIILHSLKAILIYRSDQTAKVPRLKLRTDVNFTLY